MPSTNQSKNISAPIADVWAKFTNFHDLSWAPNVITNLEPVGNTDGSEVGAKRILNGAFHETLAEVDTDNRKIKYSIDDGPSPVSKNEVSNYFGVIQLSPTADGTLVEWSSDVSGWQNRY